MGDSTRKLAIDQIVKLAVVVVLVAAAGLILLKPRQTGQRIETVYFYDTASSELYDEGVKTMSPDVAPSGSEGVRAFVFACNDCADASDRFIGYLRKFSDAYVQAINSGNPEIPSAVIMSANLVRQADDEEWVVLETAKGQAIVAHPQQKCGATAPQDCLP